MFQLVKFFPVQLLNIRAVFFNQLCHINQRPGVNQASGVPFCKNHIGIILLRNHKRHLLVIGRYRILRFQLHAGFLGKRLRYRVCPGVFHTVRIVKGQLYHAAFSRATLPGTRTAPVIFASAAAEHSCRQSRRQ